MYMYSHISDTSSEKASTGVKIALRKHGGIGSRDGPMKNLAKAKINLMLLKIG